MKLEAPGPLDRANCPGGGYEFAQTVWRYVRTLAVVARAEGARLAGDEQEFNKLDGYLDDYLQLLKDAESKVVPEEPVFPPAVYMCEHKGLAQIYVLIVEGRMAFLRRRNKEAIDKLKAAVAIEDSFAYMEPPRVYQPVRQCLGYVLLQDGQLKEAEQVFIDPLYASATRGAFIRGPTEFCAVKSTRENDRPTMAAIFLPASLQRALSPPLLPPISHDFQSWLSNAFC